MGKYFNEDMEKGTMNNGNVEEFSIDDLFEYTEERTYKEYKVDTSYEVTPTTFSDYTTPSGYTMCSLNVVKPGYEYLRKTYFEPKLDEWYKKNCQELVTDLSKLFGTAKVKELITELDVSEVGGVLFRYIQDLKDVDLKKTLNVPNLIIKVFKNKNGYKSFFINNTVDKNKS